MKIGFDLTNIKAGGGLTHITELLKFTDGGKYGFNKVVLFGGANIDRIPDQPWLEKKKISILKYGTPGFLIWRFFQMKKTVKANCDILVSLSGTITMKDFPVVSVSQNMLPFETEENMRFPLKQRMRYLLLNRLMRKSFANSAGNIFLSKYAYSVIGKTSPKIKDNHFAIIPHGVDRVKFAIPDRSAKREGSVQIVYVSTVNYYKHQIELIKAVNLLNKSGRDIVLHLIGSLNPTIAEEFNGQVGASGGKVKYHGLVTHEEISAFYQQADFFIFLSTCENMPNILLEAMSVGLPIISSAYGPMPEVLGDAAIFCDPLDESDISRKIEQLIDDKELQQSLSSKSLERVKEFSWEKAAAETFSFISSRLQA